MWSKKHSVWHTVSGKGTTNMQQTYIFFIILRGSWLGHWSCFLNISLRHEFLLSKGLISLLLHILLQITILTKLKVGHFWGEQDKYYKSSNFTFPRELKGILSSLLSKLALKKWPVGKESQGLLMCCQVQHPYLFRGLAHKEYHFLSWLTAFILNFKASKHCWCPRCFVERY